MPSFIAFGVINQNTPQQNAGIFVGEGNVGGWDANMKLAQRNGGTFGWFNWLPLNLNVNFDNFEIIDGAMIDPDVKPMAGANV